ncbi:hypothetical protein [Plantactinospora sp. WMMB782]|uniref:hypothetical protein n=1 Tax=Plantactinospora sp. WMMB782 TaxID=3404121 RepID=UPI003B93B6A0
MARPDIAGRIAQNRLLQALQWRPDDSISIDTQGGMIVIRRADDGPHMVGSRRELPLPAAARAMLPDRTRPAGATRRSHRQNLLVVHPITILTQLLTDLHTPLTGDQHYAR